MTTFYIDILLDVGESVHFRLDAASAAEAIRIAQAYCKGRFEASGKGGEVNSLATQPRRKTTYRGL